MKKTTRNGYTVDYTRDDHNQTIALSVGGTGDGSQRSWLQSDHLCDTVISVLEGRGHFDLEVRYSCLDTPIDQLNLTPRVIKLLHNAGFRYAGEVARKTANEMLGVRNFGRTSLKELKRALDELDLWLGMLRRDLFGWQCPTE